MELQTLTIKDFKKVVTYVDPVKCLGENWTGTVLDIVKNNQLSVEDRLFLALMDGFVPRGIVDELERYCESIYTGAFNTYTYDPKLRIYWAHDMTEKKLAEYYEYIGKRLNKLISLLEAESCTTQSL